MILRRLVTALLSMWFFGNLYEQLVWNPQLLADPRPGSLIGVFAPGSPFYYYVPWSQLAVVLAVVVWFRLPRNSPARRRWTVALGFLIASVAAKVVLITQVNPVFRDPAVSREVVHDNAVVWAFGNGFVVLTVGVALLLITSQRAQLGPAGTPPE
ncbi:hypothetical protein BBK82_40660 [Lentzea guizhouensis]|uniref:Uncharacterized protein n=1 Tax=Lentzea guizhouensis TaxID=1586287 RepID=A0A1B2HUF6_9PSEU|nr:hypothetical protein [Lentzea guizhouensis]ANZ41343.1 hypothetical protein BBK82_40660 [Lentzea guizhouensis]